MSGIERELIGKEFETLKERVEFILEIDEDSRNSDYRLYCQYLREFTSYRIINVNDIIFLLQNLEKYLSNNSNGKKITIALLKTIETKLSNIPSLKLFPNLQSIDRVRRKIQNDEEKYLPTIPEIAEKRNIRRELIQEYFIEQKEIEG